MPQAALRSIGQVLPILKAEFPDVSISKIRFLENEGLVSPERAPSGYRKYAQGDVERLRYVLRMQRDHYLPLKVIREHLELMDRGEAPPTVEATPPNGVPLQGGGQAPQTARPTEAAGSAQSGGTRPLKLTRRELLQVSGVSEAVLIELERQHMIAPRRGSLYYGREALTLCVAARKLAVFGMDTRHLRAIRQSAEREAGLIEQAVQPYRRRTDSAETTREVIQLVAHAHTALIYILLEH